MLTETDNPGGPKWLAGSVGIPPATRDVTKTLADLRQTTPEAIADTVHRNFLELVGG